MLPLVILAIALTAVVVGNLIIDCLRVGEEVDELLDSSRFFDDSDQDSNHL